MKSIKKYIPILIALIVVISWYVIIDRNTSESNEYKGYVQAARAAMKDDLPDVAVENVKQAWAMRQNPDIVFEMADYYIQNDMHSMAVAWCNMYSEDLKQNPDLYKYLANEYYALNDYEKCVAIMKRAKEASAYSSDLDELYAKVKNLFDEEDINAEIVFHEIAGFSVFEFNDLYGIMGASGNTVLDAKYVSLGAMLPIGEQQLAAAMDSNKTIWLVDSSGVNRVNVTAKIAEAASNAELKADSETGSAPKSTLTIVGVGSYYGGVLPVYDENGVYSLLNMTTYQPVLEGYEYIGSCMSDRIAVKKDGKWMVVNSKGEPVSENTYEDIKLDEYGFAFFNERAFVKTGGKYSMVDTKLEQIGAEQWNDAHVFYPSGNLTCVTNGSEWIFVNVSGEKQFNQSFSSADAFAHGFAPVILNGKWGYLNEKGEMIENEKFTNLRGFTSSNTALKGEEGQYSIITFFSTSALG